MVVLLDVLTAISAALMNIVERNGRWGGLDKRGPEFSKPMGVVLKDGAKSWALIFRCISFLAIRLRCQ